jgi:predicted DNA-binding transcriptional regulator AlpA
MECMNLPEVGFVRLPQILAVIPVCRATWWAGVKSGRFPAGRLLSPRIRVWSVESIRALIAEIGGAE